MNRLSFLFVLLFALAGIAGCRKTKGPASVNSVQPDNSIDSLLNMTALVNGVKWQTDSAYSYKVKNSGNDSGIINLMVVATQTKNSIPSTITFNISDFKGVGEYVLNPPLNTATYYSANRRFYATAGMFNVKKDSGGILIGVFNFSADTITVSNGTYIVALP